MLQRGIRVGVTFSVVPPSFLSVRLYFLSIVQALLGGFTIVFERHTRSYMNHSVDVQIVLVIFGPNVARGPRTRSVTAGVAIPVTSPELPGDHIGTRGSLAMPVSLRMKDINFRCRRKDSTSRCW